MLGLQVQTFLVYCLHESEGEVKSGSAPQSFTLPPKIGGTLVPGYVQGKRITGNVWIFGLADLPVPAVQG